MARLERYPLTLLGLALITACDANQIGPAGVLGTERGAIAAAVPSVLGSYAGTAAAHVRTSKGLTAAAPGGGPNVFDDAAARTGCPLVRSSGTFNGRIVDNALTVEGNAVYDCP